MGATLRPFPFPVARPYIVAGLTSRDLDDPANGYTPQPKRSLRGGSAWSVALMGLRVFAEGRYEFLDGELEEAVVRAGLLFF